LKSTNSAALKSPVPHPRRPFGPEEDLFCTAIQDDTAGLLALL
jgi:hypothetical protein